MTEPAVGAAAPLKADPFDRVIDEAVVPAITAIRHGHLPVSPTSRNVAIAIVLHGMHSGDGDTATKATEALAQMWAAGGKDVRSAVRRAEVVPALVATLRVAAAAPLAARLVETIARDAHASEVFGRHSVAEALTGAMIKFDAAVAPALTALSRLADGHLGTVCRRMEEAEGLVPRLANALSSPATAHDAAWFFHRLVADYRLDPCDPVLADALPALVAALSYPAAAAAAAASESHRREVHQC